jgi:hypothetical protein
MTTAVFAKIADGWVTVENALLCYFYNANVRFLSRMNAMDFYVK